MTGTRQLDLLVIGGTSFVGRAAVAEALRRGHRVTTFNRGRTGPDVPGVRAVRGDRTDAGALAELARHTFDAVLDPGGQVPADVLAAARALRASAPFYAFVSSAAVYRDWTALPWTETASIHEGTADDDGPPDLFTLGPRKSGCERAVFETYGSDAALVVRPGLVVGPHDNVGMLPWWLSRIHLGGTVLAPGDPEQPLQLVDARDVAAFVVDRVEAALGGVFNTMPSVPRTTIGEYLDLCVAATGSAARLVWVPDEVLLEHGAGPWNELPFWLPTAANPAAAWPVDATAARVAGMRCRPPEETVRDTWAWMQTAAPTTGALDHGIGADKEDRILRAYT
ncbi:NAD-dependent epimerase/dehydratase family protein [Pseudonocardia sp. TRM90224]|uniref:NAD-dependent epimerase/dehydratase family protein n=1 Tax=Pseudonocardia sp. TRM90224 TaxID=2812678 RepID=UPI001E581A1B|nr:NAD-dependent epimerase/dehydratase family protein [Pseudonocardia sp. TRM90224]